MKNPKINAAELFPGFEITVVKGTKRGLNALKHLGVDPGNCNGAITTALLREDGCTVVFFDDVFEREPEQIQGLIAHEAVHCASRWIDSMNETNAGEETVAFMVQCCYLSIVEGLRAWED